MGGFRHVRLPCARDGEGRLTRPMRAPALTRFGKVEAIEARHQPTKAWKHFHDPAEHWERLAEQDLTDLHLEAEHLIGAQRFEQPALPDLSGQRKHRAHEALRRHHDNHYAPIYLTELSSRETRWTETVDKRHRQHALTPRSVYVVVQLDDPSVVITAFRPKPPTIGIDWEEEDFRHHGLWRLSREDTMNRADLKRQTLEELRRRITRPLTSVREAWWMASAVGFGRVLADDEEGRTLVTAGEEALRALAPALRSELARTLDWERNRQSLAGGIEAERSEDLENALADTENLLVVADAIGEDATAKDLCVYAAELLTQLPVAWSHLVERTQVLLDHAVDRTRPIARLWATVVSASEDNPLMFQWRARLARWLFAGSWDIQHWMIQSLGGIVVTTPAPAMRTASSASWEVHGIPAAGAPHHRVFIVDYAHPAGYEVTSHFIPDDGLLWNFDRPDERAVLVVVAGRAAITERSLDEVVVDAERRSDVHIGVLNLTPPKR